MKESKNSPDHIIEELGGCGRYQMRMNVIVHLMKTIICWSVMSMIIMSATPKWSCVDNYSDNMRNLSEVNFSKNVTLVKSCYTANHTRCTNFQFDDGLKTIVSEFDLVCEYDYIPSTILSIQNAGLLVGNLLAGQLADLFGRKPPLFSSLLILIASNFVGFLSVNWIMFATCRFFVGIGCGFFLTIQYSLLSEFSLSKWRAWIVGFPSWPLEACVLALLAWLIQDWRYIKLMIALFGIPWLLTWWFIPESFRWYMAHDRPRDAEKVIRKVAEFNRRDESEHTKALLQAAETTTQDRKYTFVDLFKSRYLIRVTLLSAFNWAGLGMIAYGIIYGVQSLSGNLYLNFFLFNLTGLPTKAIAIWLQNKCGRRTTSMLCYGVTALGAFVVASLQYIETDYHDELTNGFAIFANMGIQTAWGPVQTMTIELYPTVVRTIGFGALSVIGRVGAILGPQLVYLELHIPGILYFACGGLSVLCICALLGLPETMDSNLSDKIQTTSQKEDNTCKSVVV